MNNLTTNSANINLGLNLEQEKYYYHSVKGFNLYQLTSILAFGILSKEKGEAKGISIQSNGLGLNGTKYVSASNRLNAFSYSGTHLGVIINPIGLDFFKQFGPGHIPFEIQVRDKVPKKHILGITIPTQYVKENFTDSQLFRITNTEELKKGMALLEEFYLKTLNVSLFANEQLKLAYTNALEFKDKKNQIIKNFPFLKAIKKEEKLRKETQSEFNSVLMKSIQEVYKTVIHKNSYTLVDIIQYHTDLPIYFTNGELVTSMTIEKEQIKQRHISFLKEDRLMLGSNLNQNTPFRKNFPILEAVKKVEKLREETQSEFNSDLMKCTQEIYETVIPKNSYTFIHKNSYSVVGINQYHTDLPLHFTNLEPNLNQNTPYLGLKRICSSPLAFGALFATFFVITYIFYNKLYSSLK
ncbi:hypothetical protein PARA125_000130 [Parachlamydia sp. AcF125]|nr:hypothetical protein [Parachlamydia sp. AcF125]